MPDNALAHAVVAALRRRSETIACCESLTAGLASAALADVPGASAVLRGGLVTYATDLKHTLAGVADETLTAYGPVSPATAAEMAAGVKRVCAADWGLALTGVAGPETQDGHPVGEVWLGLAMPDGTTCSSQAVAPSPAANRRVLRSTAQEPLRVLTGDRAAIRNAAVDAALRLVLQYSVQEPHTNAR